MLRDLKVKKDKLQKNYKELKTENKSLLKEKEISKKNMDSLIGEKYKGSVEIVNLKHENDNLLTLNEKYSEENSQLSKENETLKKKVKILKNNQAVFLRRYEYFDEKVKSLSLKKQSLTIYVEKISREKEKLTNQVRNYVFENFKLRRTFEVKNRLICKIAKENDNLKDQLNKMTNQVETNNSRIKTIEENYSELKLRTESILKNSKRKRKLFCF